VSNNQAFAAVKIYQCLALNPELRKSVLKAANAIHTHAHRHTHTKPKAQNPACKCNPFI